MELVLHSIHFDNVSTEGMLYQPAGFQCYTLELPFTDGLPGSAIPAGRYRVVLAPSPKFERSTDPWVQRYAASMPHIVDIPNRSLIMIHWGNDADNTDGCVLVGKARVSDDFIGSSRAAFEELYPLIHDSAANGQCFITVKRDRQGL